MSNALKMHREEVAVMLRYISMMLIERGSLHDLSKEMDPEEKAFLKQANKLKRLKYGGKAYNRVLSELDSAVKHHYEVNRHHPEHFENGVSGMDLIDVIEMVCDWIAVVNRLRDGAIHKSLDINTKRFQLCPQLSDIIKNTVLLLTDYEGHDGT